MPARIEGGLAKFQGQGLAVCCIDWILQECTVWGNWLKVLLGVELACGVGLSEPQGIPRGMFNN